MENNESKPKEDTIKIRPVSVKIIDLFENILDKNNISIPDEDRTGDEGEACIYGMTYYNLEENITNILLDFAKYVQVNYKSPINYTDL